MNKSDLKNGMHVKLRNGSIREYYKGYFIGVEYNELGYIDFYDIDLKHNTESKLDIMKVFDEDNNTIWEREEVDWSKVPIGTKVLVSNNENNWYEHLFIDYRNNEEFKFKAVDIKSRQIHNWKYCKLAEEPKEEVTVEKLETGLKQFCTKKIYDYHGNCDCKYGEKSCEFKWLLANYNLTRKDNK